VKKMMGILLILVLVLPVVSFAQSQAASGSSDSLEYKWGGALRLRNEYWKNWKDMNNDVLDNRNFFRVKTSLWGQVDYTKDYTGFIKLTNEFKPYTYLGGSVSTLPDKNPNKKGYQFMIDEVLVDNLYFDVRNFLTLPVDLRIGRQDFLGTYGEGFLIMDGTPQDGSRTFFFDAAKATWRIDPNNTLDLILINDPRDDDVLPVINRDEYKLIYATSPKYYLLNTTREKASVLYWKNKAVKGLNLEGYYIYKTEDDKGGAGLQAEETRLNTVGSFAKYTMASCILRGQLAYQFGEYGDEDREGLGGYAWIDHDFKDTQWSPQLSVGYVYLSGDDSSTSKMEGWDPLFSRFPLWSELYLLSYASETRIVGYWTNLSMPGVSLKFKPTDKMKLTFAYYYLMANENPPTFASTKVFSFDSKQRGQLPQARIDYKFDKKGNITGYFLAEYFKPGKFYVNKDPAVFLRTELQIKF